jgi:vacuolar-type H+-ATPase subunit B/Vma2
MLKKEILIQILNEQKKTNELLQTIVSSEKQSVEVRIDAMAIASEVERFGRDNMRRAGARSKGES